MNITSIGRFKNHIKTATLATLVGLSSCTNRTPELLKDTFEIADSTAAKLITRLENGERHAKIIFCNTKFPKIIKEADINKFREVPETLLQTMQELPDTIQIYYQAYIGKADSVIRKAKGLPNNRITIGHGNTGLDSIRIEPNKFIKKGDYISKVAADSMFQHSISEKDSILRANISETSYKKLKRNEKDAILSYLYNVNEKLLKDHKEGRDIPESFFECLDNGELSKVQAKFNVSASGKEANAGLAKRNLVQMIVFGNGKIYESKHTEKTLNELINKIKNGNKPKSLIKEAIEIAEDYGVDKTNLEETRQLIYKMM